MSDISRVVMDALRRQLRDLEFDAVLIRGKVEQLHATIDWLENGELPRGRPPKPKKSEVVEMPTAALNPYPSQNLQQSLNPPHMPGRGELQHQRELVEQPQNLQALNTQHMPGRVAGGQHGYAERGDGTLKAPVAETDLPSLDDVQGILKPEPETAA